jgi:CHAT domain-containing protein
LAPVAELQALDAQVAAWRELALDRAGLRALGASLMAWLFRGQVIELYRASLAGLSAEEGLRIRLRLEPPELHTLPWECCYDAEQAVFLAQDPRSLVVRYLQGPFARSRLADAGMRVLVAVASPRDLPTLKADEEYQRIEDELDELGGRFQVSRTAATVDALQDALRQGPNLLHFIGHGGFDAVMGGYLMLEDDQGGPQPVDAEVLAGLLRGSSVRLAVLNACESARTDPRESFAGVAPQLVRAGLPAVIAMQTYAPDEAATQFSRAFYGAIADDWPVDAAVTAARQALFAHAPASPVWSVPALYLTVPDGILWEREGGAAAAESEATSGRAGSSSFQFNFKGPVAINAEVVGGNQYVTHVDKNPPADNQD